jgi:hypothetical protein
VNVLVIAEDVVELSAATIAIVPGLTAVVGTGDCIMAAAAARGSTYIQQGPMLQEAF